MFKINDNENNLYIDKSLFDEIDEITKGLSDDDKHYTVLAMLGVMTVSNKFAPFIITSLDLILMTMAQDINFKATAKVKKGIMNGINLLNEKGLIELNEPLNGSAKQFVTLTAKPLEHINRESFFQISREELATIMKSKTPNHLATIFCNEAARWNMDAYLAFEEYGWNKNDYHDNNWQLYKHLGCYPERQELKTSWISLPSEKGEFKVLERSEEWKVSETMITSYINEMIELGLINRVISYGVNNKDCKKRAYYCRPQHTECLAEVLEQIKEQKKYNALKKQQSLEPVELVEPVQQKQNSFVEEHKDTTSNNTTGRQRKYKF